MTKGKSGRGRRCGGTAKGARQGGKQSLCDPTLDTEMLDGPHQRGKQSRKPKQMQDKPCRNETVLKDRRRGRVDKQAKDAPQLRQSTITHTSQAPLTSQKANSSTPATAPRDPFVASNGRPGSLLVTADGPRNPFANSNRAQNPFVTSKETKSRQTSVLSCESALSTRVGRGTHCYRCARTNRKLRQALFGLLEKALKDGRNLIDEWSWEAGVSPDHMDCERTKVHTIPQGLQSGNEPNHGYDPSRTSVLPSQTSQAPDILQPFAGTYQPQPALNPFIPARPSHLERQPPHMLAPRMPRAMPWTTANATTAAVQQTSYASDVGFRGQASQPQTKHNPFQQPQQDCRSSKDFQVAKGVFAIHLASINNSRNLNHHQPKPQSTRAFQTL